MNTGSSPYHSIQGLFCYGVDGELLSVEGRYKDRISQEWSALRRAVADAETNLLILPQGTRVETTVIGTPCYAERSSSLPSEHTHHFRAIYATSKSCHIGLLSCRQCAGQEQDSSFRDWVETFFLLETSLCPQSREVAQPGTQSYRVTEKITALFDNSIRNVASMDEWNSGGREVFFQRVFDFVSRKERIQLGLPAFPCKSPNTRKVGGRDPDMAERMALQTLRTFTKAIEEIYPQGATLWVISDGHVFSDCIGVDDDDVTKYDDDMKDLYSSMFNLPNDGGAIRFRGLTDMFFTNPEVTSTCSSEWMDRINMPHPIHTTRSEIAENARKLMMGACEIDRDHFRKLITDQHPSTLQLYRGQSRFMLDDLATPEFLSKSIKQKKKTAFAVAAEMIGRNQAYSNLVELLLPNYVRLSIHAHSNRGPKFGIRLFPKNKVRAIDSIPNRHELIPAYEFQVPTAWHNSIIKVEGDPMIYLGKAEIVQKAIDEGNFEGTWVNGPEGGHFAVRYTHVSVVQDRADSVITMEDTPLLQANKKTIVTTTTEIVELPLPVQASPKKQTLSSLIRWWFSPFFTFSFRFVGRVFRVRAGVGL
ncbi:Pyoverdine/dityrosine biosynthesis protein-domain-containing protein [Dendryphion nanum]|uniref:Pyoverdine/dityrosine biosynthesis protein-domain-containing protein n=1 Tax=Dendryphion nanum TaxID=256645 RepID=A0A9P9IJE4_9PLEO|nr:Pyoverdine/dityrosine biosynthesis protein-domain-containing protein [Dendryphion nanum]